MTKSIFTLFLAVLAVPVLCQWSSTEMPVRIQSYGTSSSDRIFVVGGFDENFNYTKEILGYDVATDTWNHDMDLEVSRAKVACTVHGNLLFTGGGITFQDYNEHNRIEIYDLNTDELVETFLSSVPRVEISAVTVGNKVLFAGGLSFDNSSTATTPHAIVDIYDVVTKEWTTAELSQARGGMAHAVWEDKAFFAGGYRGEGVASDRVDIYNATTGQWLTSSLSEKRAFYGTGAAADGKVYFAGGILEDNSTTELIDIYDIATKTWITNALSEPRFGVQSSAVGDYIVFANGGQGSLIDWVYHFGSRVVDVYNISDDKMTAYTLESQRFNHFNAVVGNSVFIVGGFTGGDPVTEVAIFTDTSLISSSHNVVTNNTRVFPNPVSDLLFIDKTSDQPTLLKVLNEAGVSCLEVVLNGQSSVELSEFPQGLYFVMEFSLGTNQVLSRHRVIKL